ncbi:MAG: MFS transporter [Bacteroidales bacterium]|nr:MFS transporter [Bacteroidales bacterium]MBS3776247.1 MFS transporter [Bacteroidales bacterium]
MQQDKTPLRDSNLHIIFMVTLLAVMGVSSITPAFPKIIQYFQITSKQVGWLIVMFTLPGIVLTPVMGVLADRFGRKTILIPSLFVFGLAGFACTFMLTFEYLLLLRFLQGIGAATLGSLNITIIGDLYTDQRRAAAMGYNASVLSIGTAAYPAIGGGLAMFGWFYPFVLPLLAIPAGFIVLWGLNNPEPRREQNLKEYIRSAWNNINRKSVWGLLISNIVVFIILYGAFLTYFPLLLEENLDANALYIGLSMSAMSVSTAIVSSMLGRLRKKFSGRLLLYVSFILYGAVLALMPLIHYWALVAIAVILFGVAHGMNIPNIQTMLVGFAPIKERAAFMSVNSMVLRIGQTAGPLVTGLFFSLGGFQMAFWSGSLMALLMVGVIAFMVKQSFDK